MTTFSLCHVNYVSHKITDSEEQDVKLWRCYALLLIQKNDDDDDDN